LPDQVPQVDRSAFTQLMNGRLEIDPEHTAVVTVDCHRGHLDPEVATMPVAPDAAHTVVANTKRLCDFARAEGMSVVHVILTWRVMPDGRPEPFYNPWWNAVDAANEMLTPDRPSSIADHNVEGSIQTELMPELGPEPGDVVIATKRRLSIYIGTDLELTLRELGIDTVLLVGINTNTCVQAAAFESHHRDLRVVMVSDCVHSMYGDDLHHWGLQNVARCLGWVLTVDEVAEKARQGRSVGAPAS
jgi:nicotinamidase-related amidase